MNIYVGQIKKISRKKKKLRSQMIYFSFKFFLYLFFLFFCLIYLFLFSICSEEKFIFFFRFYGKGKRYKFVTNEYRDLSSSKNGPEIHFFFLSSTVKANKFFSWKFVRTFIYRFVIIFINCEFSFNESTSKRWYLYLTCSYEVPCIIDLLFSMTPCRIFIYTRMI